MSKDKTILLTDILDKIKEEVEDVEEYNKQVDETCTIHTVNFLMNQTDPAKIEFYLFVVKKMNQLFKIDQDSPEKENN